MNKNFLKHFAIIGSGTIMNMFLGLINAPIITRMVDPEEYGQLSIFNMYANIGVMVLCLGLDQALVRYYYEQDTIEYKRSLLFRCIQLPVLMSMLASGFVIVTSATGMIAFEFSTTIMIFLCIFVITQIIYRFSVLVVRLEYKSGVYSMANVMNKIMYMVIAIPAVLLIRGHYLLLLVIATVGAECFCMIYTIAVQKETWNFYRQDRSVCSFKQDELLKYAYPYIFSMGITTLFQAIDKMSLNMHCTYAEVGIYASAMTFVNLSALVQRTFNTLWTPMAVEHYTKDPEDTSFHQKGNQMITIVMFFIGITLILLKDVFALLLGSKYRISAYIFPCLMFNPIMYTISETTVGGLIFKKKSKLQVVVALGACITNIIGNAILVPVFGGQGAAISTGFSYIVFFSLRTFLANKYYYVDFKLKKFYLLTLIVAIYALYNTFITFNMGSIIGYLICVALLAALYREHVRWGFAYLWDTFGKMLPWKK